MSLAVFLILAIFDDYLLPNSKKVSWMLEDSPPSFLKCLVSYKPVSYEKTCIKNEMKVLFRMG